MLKQEALDRALAGPSGMHLATLQQQIASLQTLLRQSDLELAKARADLAQARAEAVEARGGNPFRELQLPRAVLKLTQGFGRLIRGHNDRGAVVVFDKRLVTRWYGRAFLDSLPPVRVEVEPMLDLLPLVGRYVR